MKVGDVVKVKCSRLLSKGSSKFSEPKVVMRVNKSAVQLDDGKWWNKSKVSISRRLDVNSGTNNRNLSARESVSGHSDFPVREASSRVTNIPGRFHDFVMY